MQNTITGWFLGIFIALVPSFLRALQRFLDLNRCVDSIVVDVDACYVKKRIIFSGRDAHLFFCILLVTRIDLVQNSAELLTRYYSKLI